MFVLVLIFKTILKRILFDVSSLIQLFIDKRKKISYFLGLGPQIGLNLGKYQHSINFDFEGSMPGKVYKLLLDLIVILFNFHIVLSTPTPMLSVMFRRFVLRDSNIRVDRLSFLGYSYEEVLILFLVVARTPLMKMTVNTVLNLDMH